jgi:UDP-GlcNAc:undecaprenyl-phosphate/decaprenyl-phosphate GlcNAc-1-phosphate transferase
MIKIIPFLSFCLVGLLTLLLSLNAKGIGLWLGVVDIPDERKLHREETPLMGGVAMLVAFVPTAAALIMLVTPAGWREPLLIWLVCVAGMTLVGIADDMHSLSPRARLLISFLIFGSAANLDPLLNVRVLSFEHLGFELGLGTTWLAVMFTSICCVGLVNAVNMADGKNGLVIGLCLGWVALIALRAPAPLLPVIGLLIAMLSVLMVFNLRGLLFLGDGGAYGLAAAIGLFAIMSYNSVGQHAARAIAADELLLLFAVPVVDAFRLTFVRMRRGQSPMAADRDHLHHHLQDKFGWPGGLIAYFALAIIPVSAIFFSV